ncbi:hypothetical protein [Cupriavidus pampae]|uniref:Uncharacterized protein n=1 Tax=Cupriavidus pampae TaxID=659251 RepID=A0ABN7ZHW4_9BURK|nr:hypothetical protein [Cupriavidus pampae]CAG9183802.1 hypothetical protein LMG32289_05425 [Cupriavidus pampae]
MTLSISVTPIPYPHDGPQTIGDPQLFPLSINSHGTVAGVLNSVTKTGDRYHYGYWAYKNGQTRFIDPPVVLPNGGHTWPIRILNNQDVMVGAKAVQWGGAKIFTFDLKNDAISEAATPTGTHQFGGYSIYDDGSIEANVDVSTTYALRAYMVVGTQFTPETIEGFQFLLLNRTSQSGRSVSYSAYPNGAPPHSDSITLLRRDRTFVEDLGTLIVVDVNDDFDIAFIDRNRPQYNGIIPASSFRIDGMRFDIPQPIFPNKVANGRESRVSPTKFVVGSYVDVNISPPAPTEEGFFLWHQGHFIDLMQLPDFQTLRPTYSSVTPVNELSQFAFACRDYTKSTDATMHAYICRVWL